MSTDAGDLEGVVEEALAEQEVDAVRSLFRALPVDLLERVVLDEEDTSQAIFDEQRMQRVVERLETDEGKQLAADRLMRLIEGDPDLRPLAERVAYFWQFRRNPR